MSSKSFHAIAITAVVLLQAAGAITIFGVSPLHIAAIMMPVVVLFSLNLKRALIAAAIVGFVLTKLLFDTTEIMGFYSTFFLIGVFSFLLPLYGTRALTEHLSTIASSVLGFEILLTLINFAFLFHDVPDFGVLIFPQAYFHEEGLLGSGFGNPNNNASVIFSSLILFIFTHKTNSKFFWIATAIGAAVIGMTGSRYFSAAAVVLVVFRFLNSGSILGSVILGATVMAASATILPTIMESTFFLNKLSSAQEFTFDSTIAKRHEYLVNFYNFEWFPFGFSTSEDIKLWQAPHSLFIEFAFIFGFFGLAASLTMATFVVREFWRGFGFFGLASGLLVIAGLQIPSSMIAVPIFFSLTGLSLVASRLEQGSIAQIGW